MTGILAAIAVVGGVTIDAVAASASPTSQPDTVIKVRIDEQGLVSQCHVMTSSGNPMIDDKSCEIAKARMCFTPAILDGGPFASTKKVPIHRSVDSNAAQ